MKMKIYNKHRGKQKMRRKQETILYFILMTIPPLLYATCSILLSFCNFTFHWGDLGNIEIWINNFLLEFSFLGLIDIIISKIRCFKKYTFLRMMVSFTASTIITTGLKLVINPTINYNSLFYTIPMSILVALCIYFMILSHNRKEFDKDNRYYSKNARISSEYFQKLSKKQQYDFKKIADKLEKEPKLKDMMYVYLTARINDMTEQLLIFKKIMDKEQKMQKNIK